MDTLNSATAEESAAASEELSGQSQLLKDLVSQFKLKNGISNNQIQYTSNQFLNEPNVAQPYYADKY